DDLGLAVERAAVLIALAGVPLVACGMIVHASPSPAEPGGGEAPPALSGALRATASAVALGGMAVMLGAVALARPQPVGLILGPPLAFAVLTAVAFRYRLPVAHAAALACLAVGYLTTFHLFAGHLTAPREELGRLLWEAAGAPSSGIALVVLAGLLA